MRTNCETEAPPHPGQRLIFYTTVAIFPDVYSVSFIYAFYDSNEDKITQNGDNNNNNDNESANCSFP